MFKFLNQKMEGFHVFIMENESEDKLLMILKMLSKSCIILRLQGFATMTVRYQHL